MDVYMLSVLYHEDNEVKEEVIGIFSTWEKAQSAAIEKFPGIVWDGEAADISETINIWITDMELDSVNPNALHTVQEVIKRETEE